MKFDFNIFLKPRSLDYIYGARLNHSGSIYAIKNETSFPDLINFFDKNDSLIKTSFSKFYGNPLPKSYKSLGYLGSKIKVYEARSLEIEINWTLLIIRKYKWEISLFLEYKALYEKAFLLGDYETSERYLTKIEEEICFSLWSMQNRFLLYEHMKSPESQKAFLSDINKVANGYFVPYLAHFLSNRAEKNLAVSRFDFDISDTLHKLKGTAADQNREFYYSRLNRYDIKQYQHLKDILTYDGYHSVIDRYVTIKFIIKQAIASENIDKETKFFVTRRLRYLIKKFEDSELLSLYKLLYVDFEESNLTDFNLKAFDLFTAGLYEECIELFRETLKENPLNPHHYIYYVQAFLLSNKPFELPTKVACFQNNILIAIYNQLNRTIEPSEASTNLQRLIKNLDSFSVSEGLFKFLNDEVLNNMHWNTYNTLSYNYNVPDIGNFYKDAHLSNLYLKQLLKLNPNSISINFNLTKLNSSNIEDLQKLAIPDIVKKVELAKFHYRNQYYDLAKDIWLSIIGDVTNTTPILQIAIESLFNCYVELDELDKAISLFVDYYIERNYLIYRMSVERIHEKIRKSKFKSVAPTIDLPLFYIFSKGDENEIHIAYEKFNQSVSVSRPSELSSELFAENTQKWILFLYHTCTTEIFKHSIFIDGSKDGYTERIAVCRNLLTIDPGNGDIYKSEITGLTDLLIIQEGLQQLDESKIYVNESGLINSELREFEGLYNRYKTIANLYRQSNKRLVIFDKRRGVRLASLEDVSEELFTEKYSTDPLRDAFADIFDVITRKFLFSKFGISAYLSTRIRHGVLLGEVRPIFEKFNLITQKETNSGKYLEIEHWNTIYAYMLEDKRRKLQAALGKFSEQIDNIIQGLLKDSLQIKTEDENINGWFDYYFEDTTLSLHAISLSDSKDFSEFVKKVIEILWDRTDTNLEHIRFKIDNDVKDQFNRKLAELTSALQTIPLNNTPEVFTSINTCLTEIQNVLDRIASWFNRTGSQTSDFKLDKLITIVHDNVSHSYPKRHLLLTKFDVPDIIIKGEYYMHFADLFRIFFDNALKHSNQEIESIEAEVTVQILNQKLILSIKNDNPDPKSLEEIVDHNNVNLNMRKLSTEGKSGFPKADKIIRSDLKNESNSYNVFKDEQNNFTVILSISVENLLT